MTSQLFPGDTYIHPHVTPQSKLPKIIPEQEFNLENFFNYHKNPHPTDLLLLAAEVGLSLEEVKIWYQNRLSVWRRSQGLPAEEGSVCG